MPLGMAYHDFSGAPASSLDDIGVIKTRAWDISRDEPAARSNICADGSEDYVIVKRVGSGSAGARRPPPPNPPLRVAGRPGRSRYTRPLRILGQDRWGRRSCPRPRRADLDRPRVRRAGRRDPVAVSPAVEHNTTEPHREEPPERQHSRLYLPAYPRRDTKDSPRDPGRR